MKILQRYFAVEIFRSVLFALVSFLSLFAFFDLMGELQSVGRGGYQLQHAFLYVLMGLPGYIYELMPIAALIGTIYVLAQFAARSERFGFGGLSIESGNGENNFLCAFAS